MLIATEDLVPMARGVVGATGGLAGPERRFTLTLFELLAGRPLGEDEREPLDPEGLAENLPNHRGRRQLMYLLVILELMMHPVPAGLERRVEEYGRALGVAPPLLRAVRRLAHEQYVLAYWNLARNSWYVEQTMHDIAHGQLFERLRSEVAYLGVADEQIAERWLALGRLPEGTWGRAVDAFYADHGFPRPGEPHGIYELGALHDWVHVLTGYGTDPLGELEVFGFIAANMGSPRGFSLVAVTLGLFQSGTITHMHGKRVAIATSGALAPPGASEAFADAMVHGARCDVDVMGSLDFFALAERSLVEVRAELGLPADGLNTGTR